MNTYFSKKDIRWFLSKEKKFKFNYNKRNAYVNINRYNFVNLGLPQIPIFFSMLLMKLLGNRHLHGLLVGGKKDPIPTNDLRPSINLVFSLYPSTEQKL